MSGKRDFKGKRRPIGLPRGAAVFSLGPVYSNHHFAMGPVGVIDRDVSGQIVAKCSEHLQGCNFVRVVVGATPVKGSSDYYVVGTPPASWLSTHAAGREHQFAAVSHSKRMNGSIELGPATPWWQARLCLAAGIVEFAHFGGTSAGQTMPGRWAPSWVGKVFTDLLWEARGWKNGPDPDSDEIFRKLAELLAWAHAVGGSVRACILEAWPDVGLLHLRYASPAMRHAEARRACDAKGLDYDAIVEEKREEFRMSGSTTAQFFMERLAADPQGFRELESLVVLRSLS